MAALAHRTIGALLIGALVLVSAMGAIFAFALLFIIKVALLVGFVAGSAGWAIWSLFKNRNQKHRQY